MKKVSESAIDWFKKTIGEKNVVTDKTELDHLSTDWTSIFPPSAAVALLPSSAEEISKILRYCNDNSYPVVPSGGRTGLAAGAVANNGEVVISLTRLNKILSVDKIGLSIEAEAGVTTQALQEAAEQAGFFFPLDLAAKGSCHIGGNIATNAGGLKLIRFGGTREQVLGLEVVLASGEILDINYNLRKNNTGYDLKQLFLGSEGTLGIVTKATLKMMPKPKNFQLACLGLESFDDILSLLKECNLEALQVTAFEFFTDKAHEIVLKYFPDIKSPFENRTNYYVILEVEEGSGGIKIMEPFLEKIFEKEIVVDGVLAQSTEEFTKLWSLRENITESVQAHGHVRKNDIALPISSLGKYVDEMLEVVAKASAEHSAEIEIVLFGHVGDGNLHLNYVGNKSMEFGAFQEISREIEIKVFDLLLKYKGSISAEHGIGMLKKKDLHLSRNELEISIMKKIKLAMDPKGILNPGKIFQSL